MCTRHVRPHYITKCLYGMHAIENGSISKIKSTRIKLLLLNPAAGVDRNLEEVEVNKYYTGTIGTETIRTTIIQNMFTERSEKIACNRVAIWTPTI